MERLKKRAEFLAVAGGARASRRGFVLQMRPRGLEAAPARFGFTVTKKPGNSPERNRIRRRLREAVRLAAPDHALAASDYVLVGRRAALSQPFDSLVADLISGFGGLKAVPDRAARPGGPGKARFKAKAEAAAPRRSDSARDTGPSAPLSKDPPDDR